MSSYLHQVLHQVTHVLPPDAHVHKKYLLNTPYTSYLS